LGFSATDPRITMEFYGHLAPGCLRGAIDRLSFEAPPQHPRFLRCSRNGCGK
jgi:hypothetical protein